MADSFPGADFTRFDTVSNKQPIDVRIPDDAVNLPFVPRWLRTGSCGARFAFGGRLVTFELAPIETDSETKHANIVYIKQV